jgi:hypothetical protein
VIYFPQRKLAHYIQAMKTETTLPVGKDDDETTLPVGK